MKVVLIALSLALASADAGHGSGDAEKAPATAAPGYVKDSGCAICHSDLYQPYQEVGMARSFYRPSPDKVIEDLGDAYFHPPSQRRYEMGFRDGRLLFKRYQVAADGEPINVFEQEVDWILGSGNHSRTYLFATPGGELYQLPVAWYTQTSSWGMAPGFDNPDHLGVTRRVRRECMFCHNAYPDVPAAGGPAAGGPAAGGPAAGEPAAGDTHWQPHVYPRELPQGTGCQRCHGPGAEHVRAATEEMGNKLWVRASIVNPARLPAPRRDDVCDQCHLQPTVALAGVRRFGHGDYSFRPGQSLADYLVLLDVDEEGRKRPERFEINHHPYRLRQSRCFQESGRELHCTTCHDPHRKVPVEERAAHYRAACLSCHTVDACQLEAMGEGAAPAVDGGDCVTCHMPLRRTQDVVRVVMTDHYIRRRPGGEELLAPLEETDPVLVDVEVLDHEKAPRGPLGEIYRAVAVLRAGGNVSAVEHLEKVLAAVEPAAVEPYLDLAKSQLGTGRFEAADRTLREILERAPGHLLALEWLASARSSLGRTDDAVELLRFVVEKNPGRPEAWFNLGAILGDTGRAEEAAAHLERALEIRHHMAPAWFYLGYAYAELGRPGDAVASFRRTLEIDPTHGRAYLALGEMLIHQGKRAEALRYWRHGLEVAADPEPIAKALAKE